MKFIRALTVAALFAALFVLALPVHADCGDGDPTCLLEPPISVEIRTDSTSGDASLAAAESGALVPLDFAVPMPLPRRVEAPLVSSQSEIESTDSIPDFTSLSIPMRYQTAGDVSCGVQALGMALDGIDGSAPTSNSLLGFLQDQDMMYDFGTGVEELAHAAQAFGYSGSVSFHNWVVDDLLAQLAAGRPVVIDLGANGSDEPGHFVALTGISPDDTWVAYSDPLLGERMVPLDDFLDLWALQGNSGVAVAEAPPAPLSPDYAPWAALAATMMAILALAPSMLSDVKRRGVGGMLIAEAGSGTAAPYIGMNPPYAAPAGMKWLKGAAVNETSTRTEIVYHEVPKKELQRVQVGTTTKKIPYTKRILVDNGRWVTDYKSERYIRGYRNKRILDGYRTKRYVKYYRTRLVRTRWGYSRRRTPVYGYKRTPVYRNLRVPIYGTRKVPNGKHWESKWEHEEYTEYKTVVKRVYEERWVNVGFERIPEEKIIEEQVLIGYHWSRVPELNTPTKSEIDIVDEMYDIRASMPHPKLMITTAPLHIRPTAGTDSGFLTTATEGAEIIWTGHSQVLASGAIWYEVRYQDPIKGLITGWVNSGYLKTPVHIPEPATDDDSSADTSRSDAMARWLHYFTPAERAAYIAAEKQRLEAFWSEIRKLTIRQGGLGDGIEGLFIQDDVGTLFKPPKWYTSGGMPDSFYQQHLLDEETLRVLQLILMNPESLTGEITDRTWDILSNALHLSQEDLKVHVLGNASWKPESTTSVGSYPISLYVIRPHGHYLLENPNPGSGNVSKNFLGVPGGEKVQWDGRYQLGVDDTGKDVIYYHVSWTYKDEPYWGWIPNKYLAPEVKHWDPSGGIPGGFADPTFGYGNLADGWIKYHTYGEAQFLNLKAILLKIGLSEAEIPDYLSRHTNLCGPLAVMEYLNVSLEEGFRRWIEFSEDMKTALLSGETTSSANLKEFFEAFDIAVKTDSNYWNMIRSLNSNQSVIALVAIKNGDVSVNGEIAHWIRITEAKKDGMVKFYNPYTNENEEVKWDTFIDSWDRVSLTSGNENTGRLFITTTMD